MPNRLPDPPPLYDQRWATELVRALEISSVRMPRYSMKNFTTRRSLDAATATTRDIADFVCTLAADLQAAGKIG